MLLSNGNITLCRINVFSNSNNPSIEPLKAFFYTEGSAELYGVGSLFQINGGIFATNTLEINAVRGDIIKPSNNVIQIPFLPNQLNARSRFEVIYDPTVLLSQTRLPVAEKPRVIVDDRSIR